MSGRNNDSSSGVFEDVLLMVFAVTWAAIVALAAVIYKRVTVPPEEQIRRLAQPAFWGQAIEAVQCPHCGVPNESGQLWCYSCNVSLLPVEVRTTRVPQWLSDTRVQVALALVVLALIVVTAILIYQNS